MTNSANGAGEDCNRIKPSDINKEKLRSKTAPSGALESDFDNYKPSDTVSNAVIFSIKFGAVWT